jgi:hypothetical protein
MSYFLRRAAFTLPFDVKVVGAEILVTSPQAPIEVVLTVESARVMADRLFEASEAIASSQPNGGFRQSADDST